MAPINSSILFLAALSFSLSAGAATVQEVTTGIKAEPKGLIPGYRMSGGYRGSTDLNETKNPRKYSHELGVSISREFGLYTGSLDFGVDFESLGSDVTRTSSKDEYFNASDIGLSVLRTFPVINDKNNLSAIFGTDILVSEVSRYRGYRSVFSLAGILSTSVKSWLTVRNSLSAGYIWNRYRFSPVTSGGTRIGDINKDGYYAYALSPMIRLYRGLNISAAVSVRGTHYMDNTNTYDFGNSYTLSYARGAGSAYLKYINRGYADRGETNVWFVDEYRSLLELGLTYNF